MSNAAERATMPQGSQSVLDRRTVVNANANLLQLVRRGDRVLDVGCGTGVTFELLMEQRPELEVTAQLYSAGDFVDVLTARAAGANETQLDGLVGNAGG